MRRFTRRLAPTLLRESAVGRDRPSQSHQTIVFETDGPQVAQGSFRRANEHAHKRAIRSRRVASFCKIEHMTQLLKGQFWHPSNRDKVVSGILSIESSDGPSVELIGALAENWGPQQWPDTPSWATPALHGWAEGKHVTILGAYSPQTHRTVAATASLEQDISPMHGVLIGGDRHVTSVDDPIFRVLEVELDYLTFWSGMQAINFERVDNESGSSAVQISSTDSEAIEAHTGSWTIRIEKFTGFSTGKEYVGITKAKLTERCILRIVSPELSSAKSFLKPARIFQNLLTHAIRKPSSVRSMKLYEEEERGSCLAYEWHRTEIPPASDEVIDPRTARRVLFTAGQVDFQHLVSSWFDIASQLGGTLDVLMGLDYSEHSYYENKLLNAATVIEASHREFFPKSTARDTELHKNLKVMIKQALPKEHRGILSSFKNDPGYVQRCKELASLPDEKAVNELLGDVDKWSQWIRNARNDLAHLNPEEKRDIPEEVWYWLAPVTTALLHLALMGRLGISADLQQRAVLDGAFEFTSRGYREASKEFL